ncbi:MAG: hypothetical protein F6K09_31245 [Merismopedia sp. SIO2A8]|nr:hypothetical protein [Merismopedia sp. SIO2A8]
MPIDPKQSDEEFSDAFKSWDLEQLYLDLAEAKGKGLTRVEKLYLRGLLCYLSPNEIAERLHVAGDTVRNYLSKGLYRYIEALLIQKNSNVQRVKDWSRVPQLLENLRYRLRPQPPTLTGTSPQEPSFFPLESPSQATPFPTLQAQNPSIPILSRLRQWQGAPDTSVFYGRVQELETLQEWIRTDRCRIIGLMGIGGIGKTTLAAKVTEQFQDQFDVLVWRSLRNVGSIESFLADILGTLDPEGTLSQSVGVPPSVSIQIQHVMTCLHCQRCLLVLEDVQFILQSHELAGQYQPGFEPYGSLIQRIGEESHHSCLIITGWEKPKEIAILEGQTRPVRSMRVKGLGNDARLILEERGLAEPQLWGDLIMAYRGNPLALKIIATTIQELFGGSVNQFLSQSTFYLGDFTYLLYKQFERLSPLERDIMVATFSMSDRRPRDSTALIVSEVEGSLGRACRRFVNGKG